MLTNKELVFQIFEQESYEKFTTMDIAEKTNLQRTNVSSLLNQLVNDNKLRKTTTRPVQYYYHHTLDTVKYDAFKHLIGSDGSLRQLLSEMLSSLLYPRDIFHMIIDGDEGVGKSVLAKAIQRFYIENELIDESKLLFISAKDQIVAGESPLESLLFETQHPDNVFQKTAGGVLFIDEFYLLSPKLQRRILQTMHVNQYRDNQTSTFIPTSTTVILIDCKIEQIRQYQNETLLHLTLPTLMERPLEERFALIQHFFIHESSILQQSIQTNAETLRSLLLYETPKNIKQLQSDIKKGCANAYMKFFKKKERLLNVYLGDFDSYVRRGFALYITKRDKVEAIIPSNFSYIFSPTQVDRVIEFQEEQDENIYHFVEKQFEKVQKEGVDEQEFVSFLSNEVENTFASYSENEGHELNKHQLAKIVDQKVIELVEHFLTDAEKLLQLTYDDELFNGLCLHIDALKQKRREPATLHPSFVEEIKRTHPDAFLLSQQFILLLNQQLSLDLPDSEVIILASLISHHQNTSQQEPAILVAMHGEMTASSIVNVIKKLSKKSNVHAFELALQASYEHEFERLQQLLTSIDSGAGILVIYDMGSIPSMCEIIGDIENIHIEFIQAPITLIGIEAARKATEIPNLTTLKETLVNEMTLFLPGIVEQKPEVVVSLCSTGEGAAMKVKEMIDELQLFGEREVISLSYMATDFLTKLAEIEKSKTIYCIVATHNPYYRDVKFVPMTKILEKYLHEKDMQIEFIEQEDLETIFEYLGEQLNEVSVSKVRKHIPQFIQKVKNEYLIDTDQAIGLMLHVVSHIERLLKDSTDVENLHKEDIITAHFDLYSFLKKELRPIERSFQIIFSDDALANMIAIIKKL